MARLSASKSNKLAQPVPSPTSARVTHLLMEARWIGMAGLCAYLVMALASYTTTDQVWLHDSGAISTGNWGGIAGAWIAEVLYLIVGASAWWLCAVLARMLFVGYRSLTHKPTDIPLVSMGVDWIIASAGFVVLVLASAALEHLHAPSLAAFLPGQAGGALGSILGSASQSALSGTGATLVLVMMMGIGFSLFFSVSWMSVAHCGVALIKRLIARLGTYRAAQQEAKAEVLPAPVKKIVRRKERVITLNAPEAELLPVQHELPFHVEPQVVAIPKSARAVKESQITLFDSGEPAVLPPLVLLDDAPAAQEIVSMETLESTSRLIERKLSDFGVQASVVGAYPGPVVTRYEIEPATGVKGSQVVNLARDLARSLSLVSIRVVETIPGKNYMGLELPNPKRQIVRLTEILSSSVYHDSASSLTIALGKDIAGRPVIADLAKMPHLLVAGTTGSGKSVGINATILSLLYKADPRQVRMILIDPKMLELSVYEGIPHLLAPVVTDMREAGHALNWAVSEMERRYKLMSKLGVRNLAGFNNKIDEATKREEKIPNPFSLTPDMPEPLEKMPTIVIVIDELADLMMVVGKKVEELIARIAQKARAAGIHLILATQRPSVDVITGLIKANIPTRIAFQVSSKIDSRTILDQMGAEALLGMGDMLYMPPGTGLPVRVHGAFVSDEEVHRVVEHVKSQGEPNYVEGILNGASEASSEAMPGMQGNAGAEADPMYDQAVAVVLKHRRASISLVQRHLRIGYNRAARLLEQMEQSGVVSSMHSNGNREILAPATQTEE